MSVLPTAFVKSIKSRSYGAAALCLVGLVIFGSYSIAAALGASSNIRIQSGANAKDAADRHASLTRRHDIAERDLAALVAERPSAEIEADIGQRAGSRKDLDAGKGPCVGWLANIHARDVCSKISVLQADLARAKHREGLEQEMHDTAAALDKTNTGSTVANTDALALQGYLALVGLQLSVDDVNKVLVALTVAVIELGSGLAFVVAGAMSEKPAPTPLEIPTRAAPPTPPSQAQPIEVKTPVIPLVIPLVIPSVKTQVIPSVIPSVKTVLTRAKTKAVALKVVGGTHQVISADDTVLRSKVASWVEGLPLGQATPISQRDLAAQLGCSQKSIHKGLTVVSSHKLARVVSTSSGTVVTRLK